MKPKLLGWLAGSAVVMLLFLLGAWIFFDMGEGVFVIYAGVYLVIGIFSMFVSSRIRAKGTDNFLPGGNGYDCIYIERSVVGMGFLYNRILSDWNTVEPCQKNQKTVVERQYWIKTICINGGNNVCKTLWKL